MSMAWVAVGTAAVGAVASSNASSKAAKAQSAAAQAANDTQLEIDRRNREDQQPWRDRGNAAGERLNYLLGLPGGESGGAGANNFAEKSAEQIRQELLPDFRSGGRIAPVYSGNPNSDAGQTLTGYELINDVVDEAALSKEVQRRLAQQAQEKAAIQTKQQSMQNDPAYGSLLRRFSTSDLNADPVYQSGLQFGLSEGRNALQRMGAARGGFESGAMLKALTRFGNDYGSTKANESYNRFNNDNTNIFNRLSGVAGTGQAATNQVGASAVNMGNNVSNNLMSAGDARASGYIGGANAINGAIGQGINTYQQNRLISRLPVPAANSFDATYGNFLANNQGILNQGVSPNTLISGF